MSPRTDLVFRTALVVITVLVIAGLAWLLIQIEEILLAILIAAILAAGVAPIVSRLQKIRWTQRGVRLSRIAAIVLVFLGIIVVLLAVGALLVTPLVIETQQFIANFPQRTAELQAPRTVAPGVYHRPGRVAADVADRSAVSGAAGDRGWHHRARAYGWSHAGRHSGGLPGAVPAAGEDSLRDCGVRRDPAG